MFRQVKGYSQSNQVQKVNYHGDYQSSVFLNLLDISSMFYK